MGIKCFAKDSKKESCYILDVYRCPGYASCPFYKTDQDIMDGMQASFRRLLHLPPRKLYHIVEKYFTDPLDVSASDEKEDDPVAQENHCLPVSGPSRNVQPRFRLRRSGVPEKNETAPGEKAHS